MHIAHNTHWYIFMYHMYACMFVKERKKMKNTVRFIVIYLYIHEYVCLFCYTFLLLWFGFVSANSLRDTTLHWAVQIKEKRQDFIVIFTQLRLKSMPYKINTAFLCVFTPDRLPIDRSKATIHAHWNTWARNSHFYQTSGINLTIPFVQLTSDECHLFISCCSCYGSSSTTTKTRHNQYEISITKWDMDARLHIEYIELLCVCVIDASQMKRRI